MSNLKRSVALLWHGDRETRDIVMLDEHRLGPTAKGLRDAGLTPEPAVYNDDFADEVRDQLLGVDAVLVWVNPIEQGRSRTCLDKMLSTVAAAGVVVSAHPDTIQKMGTKEVLYATKNMGWGSDVRVYRTVEQLQAELPKTLQEGNPRVLKQHRGHSGQGIWKITPTEDPGVVSVRPAARGSLERLQPIAEFLDHLTAFFAEDGRIVDQIYQERLADGMVRCYLVNDKVEGFGHQEINALFPTPKGAPPEETPQPGPRLYYPPDKPEFQALKQQLENQWLPELLETLDLTFGDLPLLWDADFMFGPKSLSGHDTFVLCEINVSSVYPYPESAIAPLAEATKAACQARLSF